MSQRQNFGKIHEVVTPPNLIEIQINSYVEFLQTNTTPGKRINGPFHCSFGQEISFFRFGENFFG